MEETKAGMSLIPLNSIAVVSCILILRKTHQWSQLANGELTTAGAGAVSDLLNISDLCVGQPMRSSGQKLRVTRDERGYTTNGALGRSAGWTQSGQSMEYHLMKHDDARSLNLLVPFILVFASLCWAGAPDRRVNNPEWGK